MDRLTALRVYRRVVELQGFSAAARDLGLSNAAVSKNINELEAFLGTRLLTRTTRRMSVTEAGQTYYRRCVRILEDLEDADAAVAHLTQAPRGTLRVSAPVSMGLMKLTGILPEFLARYPEVKLDLDLDDRIVDLVNGGFDVVLRGRSTLPDSSLVSRRLAVLDRAICASAAYLDRHGMPRTPQDLGGHRCLIFSQATTPEEWSFARGNEKESVRVDGPYRVNSSLAIRDALLGHLGIANVPRIYVDDLLQQDELVTLLDDWQLEPLSLFAVYPSARYLSPKVRAFIDYLAAAFDKSTEPRAADNPAAHPLRR